MDSFATVNVLPYGSNEFLRRNRPQPWMGLLRGKRALSASEKLVLIDWEDEFDTFPSRKQLWEKFLKYPRGYNTKEYQRICQAWTNLTVSKRLRPRTRVGDNEFGRSTFMIDAEVKALHKAKGKRVLTAKEAQRATIYYPDQPQIIMSAPMRTGPEFPPRKQVQTASTLLRIMVNVTPIAEEILCSVPYASRAALFQTCQDAAWIVNDFQTTYDMTIAHLGFSEYTEEELECLRQAGEAPKEADTRGAKFLAISRAHHDWHTSSRGTQCRPFADYTRLGFGICRLFRSLELHGSSVKLFTLNKTEFVDDRVVAAMVSLMPNLERLEIVGCEMFRLNHVAPFLDFIAQTQRQRDKHIHCDIAPLFERGPMWKNGNKSLNGTNGQSRKGTFGVTWTDGGIKIPTAIVGLLFFQLLPAIDAARQEHMIFECSSLLRQYLEALPLPAYCIPLTIAAYELQKQVDAEASRVRYRFQARQDVLGFPAFPRADWPQALVDFVTPKEIIINFTLAKAMFGDEMWLETADRGPRATNIQCTIQNYNLWADIHRCTCCSAPTSRMFFSCYTTCETCRLEHWVNQETDHLKEAKRNVVNALGFERRQRIGYQVSGHFPKFKDITSRIQAHDDLIKQVYAAHSSPLRPFFQHLQRLSDDEAIWGPRGRITQVQKAAGKQNGGKHMTAIHVIEEQVQTLLYKQSLSCEDFRQYCAFFSGWTPAHGRKKLGIQDGQAEMANAANYGW